MSECSHKEVIPEVCDQTLGVDCMDCGANLAVCWRDEHVPEDLWNRSCKNADDAVPCEQDRPDYCAICGKHINTESRKS